MRTRSFFKLQWLAVCLVLFSGFTCLGDDVGVTLQTGGTQIVFPAGWERLNQPENFFVQQRARNADRNIALSAGAFTIDLTLEQYVALGIYGLCHGPEKGLELTAKAAHIPEKEVEKAVQSKIGQQMLEQIKTASTLYSFEFLSATNLEISGAPAFEVHSKMTILQSSQIIFSRQFVYQGTDPQQIVQITYASSSEDIFRDKSLIDAIKRPSKSN
ncbi:MAG: hypothetical protein ABSC01_05740 [Verrucomicrobiota bacterium]|jgi:hypothetical protein